MAKKGIFAKIKEGLTKTRNSITGRVDELIKYYREIDDEFFEELEEILIVADVGIETTQEIVDSLRRKVREEKIGDANKIKELLKLKIMEILEKENKSLELDQPSILLVVGVNGVGKTTTIGKLANLYNSQDKKVLVAAGDTFRAAAADQLEVWCERSQAQIIRHNEGADPGAVIYDAVQSLRAGKGDVLICDTAGRLHNKKNLMNELEKINRIIDRELPGVQKEVLLVMDATTGQNAITQALLFKETVGLTGLILTKLDGTAKGGVVVAIKSMLNIPIYYIGVGEGIDDLQPFDSKQFVDALFDN